MFPLARRSRVRRRRLARRVRRAQTGAGRTWEDRRTAAFQARREWLPDRGCPIRRSSTASFGASVWRASPTCSSSIRDAVATSPSPALTMYDASHHSSARTNATGCSTASTDPQRPGGVLANGSILVATWAPDIPEELRLALHKLKLTTRRRRARPDQWDGYPAEREASCSTTSTVATRWS